jgi:hypothetical protein
MSAAATKMATILREKTNGQPGRTETTFRRGNTRRLYTLDKGQFVNMRRSE